MIKFCNLCHFPIIRINNSIYGVRCVRCFSTFVHRAMGVVLNEVKFTNDKEVKVHEFSQHGAIYQYLKKRFKHLSTSEYYEDTEPGAYKKGIQCQDVQQLTFDDSSFDLMTSTEVFEHVPDDTKGYQEIYRCLKKDGYFVFSVPMDGRQATVERAKIENGKLVHFMEPEYHQDHLRTEGILAFRNYGLDLKDKLERTGFSKVEMKLIEDKKYSIYPAKRIFVCKK